MLNFFYMYAIVWGVILLLYSFGWSDLCAPLTPALMIFFVSTIAISLFFGLAFRRTFRGRRYAVPANRSRITVVLIALFCVFEFVYCRQVPLISIILGRRNYTEYTGIRTLHPLVITFASFYAQYLFYRFIVNRADRKALLDYGIVLFFIYLLQFNRGGLIISLFMSGLMFLAVNGSGRSAGISKKRIPLVAVGLVLALYGFGLLGNVRHGFAMSDSSYIRGLGKFNDSYPSWLPQQFMWAYIYIVSPIANINYNVVLQTGQSNPVGYIMTLIPDFISRRLYTGVIYSPKLVMEHVFNATAGFGTAYVNGGILGMYFLYFFMMFGLAFLWKAVPVRDECKMPCLAIMNVIVIFMFFTHTIYYSAISFQLVYALLSVFRLEDRY